LKIPATYADGACECDLCVLVVECTKVPRIIYNVAEAPTTAMPAIKQKLCLRNSSWESGAM